jgi:transcriptional regulator with XRE-family HTH domain
MNICLGVNPKDPEYQRAYREICLRLKLARKEAGMTQREVYEKMGKTRSFVSKCELGERRIDHIELQKLASIYRKPLSFFRRRSKVRP